MSSKMNFNKIGQSLILVLLFLFLLFFAVSQKLSVGQEYQEVIFNGDVAGYISSQVDVKKMIHEIRRNLAAESSEKLCMDYEFTTKTKDAWFTPLLTETELRTVLTEKMKETKIQTNVRSYTVAIEDYQANFKSIEEVERFLNQVKAEADPQQQFSISFTPAEGHLGGILNASLVGENESETEEVIPEETLAETLSAGVSRQMIEKRQYALANPADNTYETGILDMDFIETVEVFENYVPADELADLETEVTEVTKEKETNKIYVVESGDCLSVIAYEYDTTVSMIMKLNDFDNENVPICPGDELIIAVPEPDLMLRIVTGEVYEEDYNADPIIIENDAWYTTTQVIHEEGTTGHRERNDAVTYENGIEVERELIHQTIMVESVPAVIEQGTITPPTYIKPINGGWFSSGFGYRWGRLHKGVDYACSVGTTVFASSAGTVISAGFSNGYGYNVLISHPDGRMTRYAHCSKLLVTAGQSVEQGETIAKSGNTGRSTGPHLHFEIYVNGAAVNPLNYIN